MRRSISWLLASFTIFALVLGGVARGEEKKETTKKEEGEAKIEVKGLPKGAIDNVKKLFEGADVVGASKEKGDAGKTVFEVELKLKGKTIDVTVNEEGTVVLIEKQIEAKELPEAVSKTIKDKYPDGKLKIAEVIYEVESGKQNLAYYEVLLGLGEDKGVELKLTPKGEIKEVEKKGKGEE